MYWLTLSFGVLLNMKIYSELIQKQVNVLNESRFYLMSDKIVDENSFDLMFFLHGLEENGVLSESTKDVLKAMEHRLKDKKMLMVFPLGSVGSYVDKEDALGWCPNTLEKNISFINQLVNIFKNNYKIKKIFIGGFSNGAYFVSELLGREESSLFQGFWLQGGGKVLQAPLCISKESKIVLEVGKDDLWHFSTVKLLKNQLESNGQLLKENLVFRELTCGHELRIDYFEDNLQFFKGE